MAIYKSVRKQLLKQLTREQKKQFKKYVQDISDDMLQAYELSIRLNKKTSYKVGHSMPIADVLASLWVTIEVE